MSTRQFKVGDVVRWRNPDAAGPPTTYTGVIRHITSGKDLDSAPGVWVEWSFPHGRTSELRHHEKFLILDEPEDTGTIEKAAVWDKMIAFAAGSGVLRGMRHALEEIGITDPHRKTFKISFEITAHPLTQADIDYINEKVNSLGITLGGVSPTNIDVEPAER